MRIARPLWLTTLSVVLLDQATKALVVHGLDLASVGHLAVLPPWVSFRMAWNQGVNFGLFSGSAATMRWLLIGVALLISLWVLIWAARDGRPRLAQVAAGLVIGGAIGNVIDRLLYGAVADFLNVTCCDIDNPYAFNVADIAIFAGALGVIVFGDGTARAAARRKTR